MEIAQLHSQSRSEEILKVLMPNGVWGDVSQLDRFDRSEEIRALSEAQVSAKDERALGIAFLLAALGDDYELNKGKLLDALNQCSCRSYPKDAQCLDFISGYVMSLGRRGDDSLFEPLFNVSDKADGCFAESLGCFYSDMLWERPEQFMKALESRNKEDQSRFCNWAESADGSGTDEGMLRDMRHSLRRISAQSNSALAPVARRCLAGLEAGYKQTVANNKP